MLPPPQRIKHLAMDDRPREKALLHGLANLSDSELIAVLLGSGTRYGGSAIDIAKEIMGSVEGDLNRLARYSVQRFQDFKGVGDAKAVTLAAALELGRRRLRSTGGEQPTILSSQDAYAAIRTYLEDKPHEEVWLMLLSQSGQILSLQCVSRGGVTGAVVDPKIILKIALEYHAPRFILAHNHPSGAVKPSQQDIQLTNKLNNAAKFMDMKLTDHLIIGRQKYFSFLDEGMI